jgi:hypothetical protein
MTGSTHYYESYPPVWVAHNLERSADRVTIIANGNGVPGHRQDARDEESSGWSEPNALRRPFSGLTPGSVNENVRPALHELGPNLPP